MGIEEVIKTNISEQMGNFIFEENNMESRKFLTDHVCKILMFLIQEKIIHDFEVVCNATNNTDEMIDGNELMLEAFVQYSPDDEYKKFMFIMSREGVSFDKLLKQMEEEK